MRKHEPLRVPEKWQGQDRQFVIQLERLMDDLYNRLGRANDTIAEMEKTIADLTERIEALEE